MNTRTLILSAVVAVVAPLCGLAADPAAPAKRAKDAKSPAPCTATLIKPKDGRCNSFAPQRSYDQKDLESTGELNAAEALRKLDPIFH